MKQHTLAALFLTVSLAACAATPAPGASSGALNTQNLSGLATSEEDLGRQILAANDGWAAATTGTTGGSAAAPEQVYTVRSRQELVRALGNASPTPKIIYVEGLIDANVDDQNQPLSCSDYAVNGYSLPAYLQAYDPASWGRVRPSGPLEDARKASAARQGARVRIKVGSNTTIVGVGKHSGFTGANLLIDRVDNVILRNLNFQDAHDCFPAWDPLDGARGNWNSEYDTLSLTTATHVWVDRSAFSDGDNPDSAQPLYFGRPYQVHDGSLDITRGSDYVTVSYNRFTDHDKTMLIGSTNSPNTGLAHSDVGRLRVTLHHNLFQNTLQRLPRVRFGQVHVYNNYYSIPDADSFGYALGVGVQSSIYAENNFFRAEGVSADRLLYNWSGTNIHMTGTLLNGTSAQHRVDVLAAFNAVNEPDLGSNVGWTPTLVPRVHPTQAVPAIVEAQAGPR